NSQFQPGRSKDFNTEGTEIVCQLRRRTSLKSFQPRAKRAVSSRMEMRSERQRMRFLRALRVKFLLLLESRAPWRQIESRIAFGRALQRFFVPIVMARQRESQRFELALAAAFDQGRHMIVDALARPRVRADPVRAGRAIGEIEEETAAAR